MTDPGMGGAAGAPAAPWRRIDGDALVLSLHVQPGAAHTVVAGLHGAALKIRLAAPPVDGRANDALQRFLADAFDVPLRAVTLLRGASSRQKLVRIVGPRKRPDLDWA
jgi:uncharacterized protein (TIGR00251 family)